MASADVVPNVGRWFPSIRRQRRLLAATFAFFCVVALTVAAQPAAAYPLSPESAHYPVLQYNHRGNDVKSLQYLLKGWGYAPSSIDGVFGSGTRSKVQQWQSSRGLSADGYMVDADWAKMVPTLSKGRPEMARDHVRALQYALNSKRSAGLAVDGLFGSGTKAAVQSFQSHMGISADGVVGPTTWKYLLWHYELMPDTSTTCNPSSNNIEEWGHSTTVGALLKAATYLNFVSAYGDLPFWDLSNEHSGITTHQSHKHGMDVDLGFIKTNNAHCTSRAGNYNSSNYYYSGTTYLVTGLKQGADFNWDGGMRLIYFSDADVQDDHPGLVLPYSGHDNHLHVRYCSRSQGPQHTSSEETKWTGGNCA